MEVLLDSPLNSAHQHGRKADKLLTANRFDDAIEYHQKAKACLAQAMLTTTDKKALESLRLQQSRHDQQEALILYKQKTAHSASHTSVAEKVNTDRLYTIVANKPGTSTGDVAGVERTMRQCDTLLKFLDDRLRPDKCQPNESDDVRAVKVPKDERTIIEELRVHNEALREHICELLEECDSQHHLVEGFRTENATLRDRVAQLERSLCAGVDELDHQGPLPLDMNVDDLASLPLAPLEMPHFDYDSLVTCKANADDKLEREKTS